MSGWPTPDRHESFALQQAEAGCDYVLSDVLSFCGSKPCTHRFRWWALCAEHAKAKYHPPGARVHKLPFASRSGKLGNDG